MLSPELIQLAAMALAGLAVGGVVYVLVMPFMSGGEVARRVQPLRPGIKVLFVSGYAGLSLGPAGTIPPGAAFLQKPFRAAILAAKVREVLDAKVPGPV